MLHFSNVGYFLIIDVQRIHVIVKEENVWKEGESSLDTRYGHLAVPEIQRMVHDG